MLIHTHADLHDSVKGPLRETKHWVFAKGAVESIFNHCTGALERDQIVMFSDDQVKAKIVQNVIQQVEQLAALGLVII